jgi:hypothetical protein
LPKKRNPQITSEKQLWDGALHTDFPDVPGNTAPFPPRTLLHNPPRDGAAYDHFDSSASTKRLNS